MKRRSLIAAFIAIAAVAAVSFSALGAQAQSTVHVDSANFYYCDPSFEGGVCETTITAGDTIVWDNIEGVHTVTECNAEFTVCPPAGGFDSGFLSAGDTYSLTFNTPGTFPYWCTLHPFDMRGRVIVQEPTPTPSPDPTAEPTAQPTATPVGQTASPTSATTATPGSVPTTGGPTGTDHSTLPLGVLLSGIIAGLLGAGALAAATVRR